MTDPAPRSTAAPRIGVQPIAIAAVALALVLIGIGSMALWRTYTGNSPETDRAVATRQLQARAAQASEQLVEKTKGLEATQQEIDRSAPGGAGPAADGPPPDRRATGRYQEAVGAGRRPDGGDRRFAAVLCQRAGDRASGGANAKTVKIARRQERPQARQIERLRRADLTLPRFGRRRQRYRRGHRLPRAWRRRQPAIQQDRRRRLFFSSLCELVHTRPPPIRGKLRSTGWREPILISGAGKVVGGILRQRPCFFMPSRARGICKYASPPLRLACW